MLGAGAVKPGDVAVLVRYNRHAVPVRDALDDVGIPSVINGAGSVFATPAAREWLRLLEALERPASPVRARAATMTSFLGWTAEQVAAAGDDEWEEVHRRLHAWAARAAPARAGVADRRRSRWSSDCPGRVLGVVDGERRLTDLRHVGQLLHGAASAEQLGDGRAGGVAARSASRPPRPRATRSARAGWSPTPAAVQVLTIHRSKGLEFPVVYVPVPVGADVGRRQARPDRLPRPRRRHAPHDRRRPRRLGLQAPQGPGTSRSSAARTCAWPTSP